MVEQISSTSLQTAAQEDTRGKGRRKWGGSRGGVGHTRVREFETTSSIEYINQSHLVLTGDLPHIWHYLKIEIVLADS